MRWLIDDGDDSTLQCDTKKGRLWSEAPHLPNKVHQSARALVRSGHPGLPGRAPSRCMRWAFLPYIRSGRGYFPDISGTWCPPPGPSRAGSCSDQSAGRPPQCSTQKAMAFAKDHSPRGLFLRRRGGWARNSQSTSCSHGYVGRFCGLKVDPGEGLFQGGCSPRHPVGEFGPRLALCRLCRDSDAA